MGQKCRPAQSALGHIAINRGAEWLPVHSSFFACGQVVNRLSDDFGKARTRAVGLQVFVEHHRHAAHEEPAQGRDLDAAVADAHQPLLLHLAHLNSR